MRTGPWRDAPTAPAPPPFVAPAPLGVGASVMPGRLDVLARVRHLVDVVEVSPDLLALQRPATGGGLRTRYAPELAAPVLEAVEGLPVVVHGLELSIGSAGGWNDEAVEVLDAFGEQRDYRWSSEHLGFLTVPGGDGRARHAGVPLPLPFTREAVDVVAGRADELALRTGRPFLLENAACYLPDLPADAGWDEARFLTELCERSSCGLLLDLFNLYVNCVNHGLDPWDLLERIPLDRVVELHVAGGDQAQGFLLDSHSRVVPEPVWALTEWVLQRAPHVAALVVEVLEESFDSVGIVPYLEQLDRAVDLWHWSRPAAGLEALARRRSMIAEPGRALQGACS